MTRARALELLILVARIRQTSRLGVLHPQKAGAGPKEHRQELVRCRAAMMSLQLVDQKSFKCKPGSNVAYLAFLL